MSAQGGTWLLSLSGSTKRNLRHMKARTAHPSPFSQRENMQGFPWELRSQFPRFGLFIPCNRKKGLPS